VTAVEVLAVPLDSGQLHARMASGVPLLAQALDGATVHQIFPAEVWRSELRTTFAAHQLVAAAVSDAAGRGALPIVVSGDCSMAVAAVAGLGTTQRVGVLWMDAHGDFNTPETDARGYLDGQGLAMLVGRCWTAHTTALEGFVPVPEQRVLLAGARDLDPLERAALEASPIARLEVRQWRDGLWKDAVDSFCEAVDAVHVHVDVDVLDPSFGIANDHAAADGVRPGDVTALVRAVARRRPIASLSFASWDRDREDAGELVDVVPRLARELVRAAR
jgi:arginase